MTGATLFMGSLYVDSSGIDVPINFHITTGCSNIQHALFPLATGKCKCREAGGDYNKSCNEESFEH
jgi:hypothetical protein